MADINTTDKRSLGNQRIGEQRYNNQGELMTITDYINTNNIVVKFEQTKQIKHTNYQTFKKGTIKDNFYPSVENRGYIGGATTTYGNRNIKRSYRVWVDIFIRCYDENYREKFPTYVDCEICDEWLCYANFEKWYNENYYEINNERMSLDKDILVKGNKIYSPDTCIFVPQKINVLFTNKKNNKRKYPIGVFREKDRFVSQVSIGNRRYLKSRHKTPEEAFYAYKERKEKLIKQVADEYKGKIPQKLYDAMYAYKVEITD